MRMWVHICALGDGCIYVCVSVHECVSHTHTHTHTHVHTSAFKMCSFNIHNEIQSTSAEQKHPVML